MISDFYSLWYIKVLFPNPPSYDRSTKLDMAARKMIGYDYPMGNQWRDIAKYTTNESLEAVVGSLRR